MYKKKSVSELEVGDTFAVMEQYSDVYQKLREGLFICVLKNGKPTFYDASKSFRGNSIDWDVWMVDVDWPDTVSNTYQPEPEPEPKFKVGDLVKVLDDAWNNRLVGQIVRVNTYGCIREQGEYAGQFGVSVVGARLDGSGDNLHQIVPESSLELVCSI